MGSARGMATPGSCKHLFSGPAQEQAVPSRLQQHHHQHLPQQQQQQQQEMFPEAPTFQETIERLVSRHSPTAHTHPENGMVLWQETLPPPPERARVNRPFGLGAIQQSGRDEVLQQFCRQEPPVQSTEKGSGRQPRLSHGRESSTTGRGPQPSLLGQGGTAPAEALELEWSSLSDAAKHAVKQWMGGQVGGRHCMLVLESNGGTDSALAMLGQDEPMTCDLRGGAALNVLSGLLAEVGLIGGSEVPWLFEAVFSKPPRQVLEDALSAAVAEIADPRIERTTDLSAEQANLALRRRVMKAQYEAATNAAGPTALAGATTKGGHAPATDNHGADECTRVQIWLELVRLHIEGAVQYGGSSSSAPAAKDRDRSSKEPVGRGAAGAGAGAVAANAWYDGVVIKDIGKEEADLEAESQQMGLEALRVQNKAIEEYVMRLVRQRDELKHITKMAEERDAYYILGLHGPEATDSEVKKAYRNLARKEHPDKAGQANHKRFQAIQHAYNSILRQRRESAESDGAGVDSVRPCTAGGGSKDEALQEQALSAVVAKATELSKQAINAADKVAMCAHRCLRSGEEASELKDQPTRKALQFLRELTKQGAAELRIASEQLRILGEAACSVAICTEEAMLEHMDWAGMTVAGSGLRDRAVIVEDAGGSSQSTADLLEKIGEATEATLKKVEKASPEGAAGQGRAARGGEATNLLRLGTRLLGESLSRTAAVARRSADEAITGAMKAFDLSRGLAAMDIEARKEREKQAAKRDGFDEDCPVPAGDAEGREESAGEGKESQDVKDDDASKISEEESKATPRDQLKSAAKRVKERHVALRVKNLKFLCNLNEEALRMQGRLRALLLRSEGTLLPKVTVDQKQILFDLIAQLFDSAFSESVKLGAAPSADPHRVLERSLSFALALEHVREIAMPSDSRTQALKLAALVDADLLCEIIEGPFRRRLLLAGTKRKVEAAPSGYKSMTYGSHAATRNTAFAATSSHQPGAALKAWEDAVNSLCFRVCGALRHIVKQVTVAAEDDE